MSQTQKDHAANLTYGLFALIDYPDYTISASENWFCIRVKGPVESVYSDSLELRGWVMDRVSTMMGKPTEYEDWTYSL